MTGKTLSILCGLGLVLLIPSGCETPAPNLAPKDVMTRPDVDYKDYSKVVVFIDMSDLPEGWRDPAFVWNTEAVLRERGFNVLGHNAYMDFLRGKSIYPSQSGEPRVLALVKQDLGVSAVIRLHIGTFKAWARRGDPLKTVTPGVPGSRGTGATTTDVALRERSEWVVDISLAFDMIDVSSALPVWSCSLERRQSTYEGKVADYIKKAVAVCLDTLPAR